MEKIILSARVKYGDKNSTWKPNLLTAILQILLSPVAFVLSIIICVLAIVLDMVTMGSQHIMFSSTPKKIEMPDGSILP